MPKITTVGPLGMEHINPAGGWDTSGHIGINGRTDMVRIISGALEQIDQFAGTMTGSAFYSTFCPVTGSVIDMSPGGSHQAAGVMGLEYNRQSDRVVTEVVLMAAASGSNPAGVVRVDVQIQNAANDSRYSSIFSNNAFKPAFSGSTGFGLALASTFVSGSNQVWKKGTVMKVIADLQGGIQTGLGAMSGLQAMVYWKPSASYAV